MVCLLVCWQAIFHANICWWFVSFHQKRDTTNSGTLLATNLKQAANKPVKFLHKHGGSSGLVRCHWTKPVIKLLLSTFLAKILLNRWCPNSFSTENISSRRSHISSIAAFEYFFLRKLLFVSPFSIQTRAQQQGSLFSSEAKSNHGWVPFLLLLPSNPCLILSLPTMKANLTGLRKILFFSTKEPTHSSNIYLCDMRSQQLSDKNAFKQLDSPRNHWLGHVPHVVSGLHTWKRQCRASKKVFLSCNAKHSGYSLTRHKPTCVICTLLFPCMKKKEKNILCLGPSKMLSDFSQGHIFKDKEKGFYLLFFLCCHPCNIG